MTSPQPTADELDEIFSKWRAKMLTAASPSSANAADAEAKAAIVSWALGIIGEDEPRTGTNAHIDIEREGRNRLRAELKQRIEKP